MADNILVTPGTGATVGADDVGGVLIQRVKDTWGPDGTANDTDIASGKALPVQMRSATGLIPVGEPTDAAALQTDTTSVSAISLLKQLSKSLQALGLVSSDAAIITDATGTAHQYLRGLIKQWISSTLTLASRAASAAVTLTRTADTNAYAANDVLGSATGSTAALTFAAMGPSGADVTLTSVSLEIDASALISGESSYRLYLYNVTPPSALGDNAAWDLPSGDRASFLGYVDLGTVVDLGSTLYVQQDNINKQIKLLGTSIFGYLVTIGGYTPTSARVHVVTLHSVY